MNHTASKKPAPAPITSSPNLFSNPILLIARFLHRQPRPSRTGLAHPACYRAIKNRVVFMTYPGTKPLISSRLSAVNVKTMDGRRSRYWCGLCSGGETKPVVAPDDYQASGALRISYENGDAAFESRPSLRERKTKEINSRVIGNDSSR